MASDFIKNDSNFNPFTVYVFFSVFIKIPINDNVGFSHFYVSDQFWQCWFFPFFQFKLCLSFNVGKTLIEMLHGLCNLAAIWKQKNYITYVYKFLSVSGVSRVKIERNNV